MEREIKFLVNAVKWFDRVNGNTYHSVRIERVKDGAILKSGIEYGYGDQYKQTALEIMALNNWIPSEYNNHLESGIKKLGFYERENNYPIVWSVSDGLKREMKNNIS